MGTGLRERFLAAVRGEQNRSARPRTGNRVWQMAAAVFLVLNLALSAANGFRYSFLPAHPENPAPFAAGPMGGWESENAFWAVAEKALARLTPAPDPGQVGRLFWQQREN
jgi:hypothetical protein